jgi:hypothetical protein
VEFIQSDLMRGSEPDVKVAKKKRDESDESMDESDFEAVEKRLTP